MANDEASRKRKSEESIKQTKKRPKMTFGGTITVKARPEDTCRTFVVHEDLLLQRSRWLARLCEKAKPGQKAVEIDGLYDVEVVEAYLSWLYDRNLDLSIVENSGETRPMIEDQDGQGLMHDSSHLAMFRRITGLAKMHILGDYLEDCEFTDLIMETLSDCNMENHRGILIHLARGLIKMELRLTSSGRLTPPILWVADVMSVTLTSEQLKAVLRDDELPRNFIAALMDSLVRLRDIATSEDDLEVFKTANMTRYHDDA